ncbi:hypothetical protein CIB48_g7833 [Xylaria polymorpha]|nr:hypothetical protein CIB48_g7833 [Xylaria polymorpha]
MATDDIGDGQVSTAFSWLEPHPLFCIILVGENVEAFGVQKDFLIAKSTYFRRYFAEKKEQKVEDVVRFPDTDPVVFGLAQLFMFTGTINTAPQPLPGYDLLIAVWKLGNELGIEGLCEEALKAMSEYRAATNSIPATELLVKAWNETPEGSPIRALLLSWTAEYIRSSESRAEFTKSLPQEVLSELVVAMSHLNSTPVIQVKPPSSPSSTQHKNVHYLDHEGFWTRLVGPFKEPVRPVEDGVPNYFDKIKKPMDLGTIKKKVDRGEYNTAEEFELDIRQIFENCYTYWGRTHDMSAAAERFQKSFEEKFAEMYKWLSKNAEGIETV